MISLIALPVLMIPFLITVTPNANKRVLEIIAYRGKPPERNNIEILLTGNEVNDRTKLDFCKLTLSEIVLNQDTIHGIHIKFSAFAKYKSLVQIIDDFNRIEKLNYTFDGTQISGYYLKPVSTSTVYSFVCGTDSRNHIYPINNRPPDISNYLSAGRKLILVGLFLLLTAHAFKTLRRYVY